MKKVFSALLLIVVIAACAGCAQKIIPVETSYAPEIQSGLPNGTVVMVRTVAGTFFDKPAEIVVFANKLFNHAWGREYAGILKNSFDKGGCTTLLTNATVTDGKDIQPVVVEGKKGKARYAVLSHCEQTQWGITDHTAANISKSLIPIAGSFIEKKATMTLGLRLSMTVYDLESNSIVLQKQYDEAETREFGYVLSDEVEQILRTRIAMFNALTTKNIATFWDDFGMVNRAGKM